MGGAPAGMALDASWDHLLAANDTLPRVRVLDTWTGALVHTLALGANTVLVDSARRLVLATNAVQPGLPLSYDNPAAIALTGAAAECGGWLP